jgi:hypothetical protein
MGLAQAVVREASAQQAGQETGQLAEARRWQRPRPLRRAPLRLADGAPAHLG